MFETLLLTATLAFSPSFQADGDWQPLSQRANVSSFKQDVPDSRHAAYRADATICARGEDLFDVFADVDGFAEWLPRTESIELLERDGLSQLIYVVSNAPWPLRPRDMVYRVTLDADPDAGHAEVIIEGLSDHVPKRKGRVRLEGASGIWTVKLEPKQASASFMLHVDVGRVPALFAGRSLHRAVRGALTNLQGLFPCE